MNADKQEEKVGTRMGSKGRESWDSGEKEKQEWPRMNADERG
jgi:hypothetical protein